MPSHRGHRGHIHIYDAPAARWPAEWPAIVYFTGIRSDHITCICADLTSSARGYMRSVLENAESVGIVPMSAEMTTTQDVRAVNSAHRRTGDMCNVRSV